MLALVQKHARVVREACAVSAHKQDGGAEALIAEVQALAHALLECRAVKEGQEVVHVCEVEVDERREQVGRREVLVRWMHILCVRWQPLYAAKFWGECGEGERREQEGRGQ